VPESRRLERRNRLILEHLHLVEPIAWSLLQRCPAAFEVDDLIALGRFGLMQAAGRYKPKANRNTPFPPYAKMRIRGAILDGIRRKNWIEAGHESLNALLELQQSREEGQNRRWHPGLIQEAAVELPVEAIDARRMLRRLQEGRLRRLSPLQTRILSLYYSAAAPTLQQIAQRLRISAEIVSREHAAGLRALQTQFGIRW
jgi:RNA polymerase sigma factor FliA